MDMNATGIPRIVSHSERLALQRCNSVKCMQAALDRIGAMPHCSLCYTIILSRAKPARLDQSSLLAATLRECLSRSVH